MDHDTDNEIDDDLNNDDDSDWSRDIDRDDFAIEYDEFILDYPFVNDNYLSLLTETHAARVANALTRSTKVEDIYFNLRYCPLATIPLFVDYIKSSPLLKKVEFSYTPKASDSQEIQELYNAKIGDFLLAVRENPSIQKLQTWVYGNNPNVMYDLLSNNNSLKKLVLLGDITREAADSIMAGMKNKSFIKKLKFCFPVNHGHIIVCGLIGSSVESVTLDLYSLDAPDCDWVSIILHATPTLTRLKIVGHRGMDASLGKIFFHLVHPACSGLKRLFLHNVSLSAGTETHPHTDQVNTGLKYLRLQNIRFVTPRDARLLWHLEGLQELELNSPAYESSSDMQDEFFEPWAELIRRNKDLSEVYLGLKKDHDDKFVRGVLQGARDHEFLSILTISAATLGRQVCSWLSEMLQETVSLQELHFSLIAFDREFSRPLVQGLRRNRSVKVISFKDGEMEAETFVDIILTLLVNTTIQELSFNPSRPLQELVIFDTPGPPRIVVGTNRQATYIGGHLIGQMMSQVFASSSMVKLDLPYIDFRAGAMAEALIGLRGNKVLKTLTLNKSRFDSVALIAVGQALESTDIALEEIGLDVSSHSDFVITEQRDFLQSLARMPTIRKVHFWCSQTRGDELCGLLLHAVMENKNIRVLDNHESFCHPSERPHFMSKVDYYLKLNRFGRSLLDSPNVCNSLWPRIFSQMTRQPENFDALFYFVKEYFGRKNEADDDELKEFDNCSAMHSSTDTNHDLWPRL